MSRPQSIPGHMVDEVVRLARQGFGARRIAKRLESVGIWTTKSSVHRLLAGQSPYQRVVGVAEMGVADRDAVVGVAVGAVGVAERSWW